MRSATTLLAIVFGAIAVPHGLAYPEPSLASRAWQFDFNYAAPRPVAVKDSTGGVRWYWFLAYKLVNRTDTERFFVPEVVIADDEGNIIEPTRNLDPSVFAAIRDKLNNPLLERPDQVLDKVLRGEDYARESVVAWPASVDAKPAEVSLFITGLSGESADVADPVTGQKVTLRKTLQLTYQMPGRPDSPQAQEVIFKSETWVMR